MEQFERPHRKVAHIADGEVTDRSFSEEQERRDKAVRKMLAAAALKNDTTEAGRLFEVKIPEENVPIDRLDLLAPGASRAVPLGVIEDAALFQATTTSALVRYVDWESIQHNTENESQSQAAD